jgi:uncharacterized damage-inducible protein DinB
MTPDTAALMANYNRWINQRIFEAAFSLPPEEVSKERGAFFGSLFQTLNHIAAADTIWLYRFAGHTPDSGLSAQLQPFALPTSLRYEVAGNLDELKRYRVQLDDVICNWAQTLTAAQLAAPIHYRNMAGQPAAKNFGFLLQHYFNHQTHHRGQASTLLFQAGVDVGVTDLLAILPEA